MLTDEQKGLIENNQGLIAKFISSHGRPTEDDFQDAALWLCQFVANYDPQKSRFSTFAMNSMKIGLRRKMHMQNMQKRAPKKTPLSLDAKLGDDQETDYYLFAGAQDSRIDRMLDNMTAEQTVEAILSMLRSPVQKQICQMILAGYDQKRISRALQISRQAVNKHLKQIKKRAEVVFHIKEE